MLLVVLKRIVAVLYCCFIVLLFRGFAVLRFAVLLFLVVWLFCCFAVLYCFVAVLLFCCYVLLCCVFVVARCYYGIVRLCGCAAAVLMLSLCRCRCVVVLCGVALLFVVCHRVAVLLYEFCRFVLCCCLLLYCRSVLRV